MKTAGSKSMIATGSIMAAAAAVAAWQRDWEWTPPPRQGSSGSVFVHHGLHPTKGYRGDGTRMRGANRRRLSPAKQQLRDEARR